MHFANTFLVSAKFVVVPRVQSKQKICYVVTLTATTTLSDAKPN